jgi:hypothetical protein
LGLPERLPLLTFEQAACVQLSRRAEEVTVEIVAEELPGTVHIRRKHYLSPSSNTKDEPVPSFAQSSLLLDARIVA